VNRTNYVFGFISQESIMHVTTHDKRLRYWRRLALLASASLAWGCGTEAATVPGAARTSANAHSSSEPNAHFNLEVILRAPGEADGFGHVKFRQANDPATIVDLDVWVRDLAPNRHYKLQRAVDTVVDGNCTSTSWLTLGKGAVPQDIVTDEKGTGREELFRLLANPGSEFDIHFRVIDAVTSAVVLTSECYQFFVR
jgi:hypothetical protein